VLHGGALPSFADRHPHRVRRLLAQASVVVSPSPFLARSLHHLRDDIIVIPNQLPLRAYPARTRGPARPRLLWMRTLHPIYRPDLALTVLQAVRRTHPAATLTLAGQDKGLLRETQRQADSLGLGDAVTFPGFLGPDAKRRAFEDHDIFLSTNSVDNAPVSVLEAAASGLVVVAMDVGGLRDLVVDGENGVLVRDGDERAMAAAVVEVLDDPARAQRLSEGARRLGSAASRAAIAAAWEECLARAVRS
jgi:glycosyltransferase involved in cell wall biosynthesis